MVAREYFFFVFYLQGFVDFFGKRGGGPNNVPWDYQGRWRHLDCACDTCRQNESDIRYNRTWEGMTAANKAHHLESYITNERACNE